MQAWLTEHYVITYLLIVAGMAFVYNKVFRPRKLPLLKDVLVYFLIAVGSVILWIFQIDASLPIVESLLAAILLMALYRARKWILDRRAASGGSSAGHPENGLEAGQRADGGADNGQRKLDT